MGDWGCVDEWRGGCVGVLITVSPCVADDVCSPRGSPASVDPLLHSSTTPKLSSPLLV